LNTENCNISVTVSSIATKFGAVTHIGPSILSAAEIRTFENPTWRTATILNIEKPRYRGNGIIDYGQIWHDGAF